MAGILAINGYRQKRRRSRRSVANVPWRQGSTSAMAMEKRRNRPNRHRIWHPTIYRSQNPKSIELGCRRITGNYPSEASQNRPHRRTIPTQASPLCRATLPLWRGYRPPSAHESIDCRDTAPSFGGSHYWQASAINWLYSWCIRRINSNRIFSSKRLKRDEFTQKLVGDRNFLIIGKFHLRKCIQIYK